MNTGLLQKGCLKAFLSKPELFCIPNAHLNSAILGLTLCLLKLLSLNGLHYAAYVTIDEENNLAGDIIWERLS